MKLVAVLCLLAAMAVQVYAMPNGAPPPACTTITPGGLHLGVLNSVNVSDNPFRLDLSELVCTAADAMGYCYTPGTRYQITLSGAGSEQFRGLLVQGRQVAGASPVGTFSDFTSNTRISMCTPAENAVTHSNPSDKTSAMLTWTAPSTGTGPVIFLYAVVVELQVGVSSTWYAPNSTPIIMENGASFTAAVSIWSLLTLLVATYIL